jgi:hypothetical protein
MDVIVYCHAWHRLNRSLNLKDRLLDAWLDSGWICYLATGVQMLNTVTLASGTESQRCRWMI